MKKKRMLAALFAIVLLVCCGAVLMACAPDNPEVDTSIFQFKGVLELDSVKYNVSVKGWDDEDKTLELTVKEMKGLSIDGTYEAVEGYGYLFTFFDAQNALVKVKYDSTTKELYFNYKLSLGTSLGDGVVKCTYSAPSFALNPTVYPQWDFDERVWEGSGTIIAGIDVIATIECAYDGTFISYGTCSASGVASGSGVYTFKNNVYSFEVTEGGGRTLGNKATSTYDAEKNTYSVTFRMDPVIHTGAINCKLTFTPMATQMAEVGE